MSRTQGFTLIELLIVIAIIGTPTVSQSDYSFTIQDTRDSKTYTITANSVSGS
jgi:prepilin-type N-terminal cleavage/methylation domain-containing protein